MPKSISIKELYPPGDLAIWIVIYVELMTFSLLFLGYAFSRRLDVELFNASQLAVTRSQSNIWFYQYLYFDYQQLFCSKSSSKHKKYDNRESKRG